MKSTAVPAAASSAINICCDVGMDKLNLICPALVMGVRQPGKESKRIDEKLKGTAS